MDDGEGLFILAAVVIAFVNWLSTTLKQRAAKREIEKRRARGEVIPPEPIAQEDAWPEPEPEASAVNAPDQLRAFFESLQPGSSPPPPPPPPDARSATPPPMDSPRASIPPSRTPQPEPDRWKAPEVKRAKLTDVERQALAKLEQADRSLTMRSRTQVHPLIAKLRRSGGAREAIIFSEILGKPKALADS